MVTNQKTISKSQAVWIILGVLSLLVRWGVSGHPNWVENYYSRGLFQVIRCGIDFGLAWLPLPLIYLFLLGFFFFLVRNTFRVIKTHRRPWWKLAFQLLAGLLSVVGFLITLFFWFWGFNYGRIPVEDQLKLALHRPTYEEIKTDLLAETEAIKALRAAIPEVTDAPLQIPYSRRELERRLRADLVNVLRQSGYPTPGRVRGRWMYPKGIFLRFSSAGLYFPFTGEGHIDAGLIDLQWPPTMSHELAHGYGFGDEGVCSFWAYLACEQSKDPVIAYMGRLSYWRSLAIYFKIKEPEAYAIFRAELPQGIIADLDAINENLEAYPDIAPKLRYQAYDAYLRAQGVKEGMENYSKVVLLVQAWKHGSGTK